MAVENKVEKLKREKDCLDIWPDIPRLAGAGYKSIAEDDLIRLRWYGIYQQRPNDGYFMVRVKIPGGQLTAVQMQTIAEICRRYGRGTCDITTRQDIQLHWVAVEDFPAILQALDRVGIYLNTSCGDGPRNIVACPLAGLATDELFDCAHLPAMISRMYKDGGKEYSNLPRKFKLSLSACPAHCPIPQIHCLSLFAVQRQKDGREERGFGVSVGGGLRDTPHFAQSLRVFVPYETHNPDHERVILDICRATAHLFRDTAALRESRTRARLKFYVAQVGWEKFRTQLEERLGYQLDHDESIVAPVGACVSDHLGVGPLKNGACYVGVPVPCGRSDADTFQKLAGLAAKYSADGEGLVRLTARQNLIFLNIPPHRVDGLVGELTALGLPPVAHALRGALVSCTGIQFCNLAIVETKERCRTILAHLEAQLPAGEKITIHISGCPNSCAQYQIADIGLRGWLMNWQGQPRQEGFAVEVGGRLGENPGFGRVVTQADGKKLKLPAAEAHLAIAQLIQAYLAGRSSRAESFGDFASRQDISTLCTWLTTPAMRAAVQETEHGS